MREGTVQPKGEILKRRRLEQGWSQEVLAKKVGCSKRTIENAEAGRPVYPKSLAEIGAAFDPPLTVKDLVADPSGVDVGKPFGSERVGNAPTLPSLLVGRERDLDRLAQRMVRAVHASDSPPSQAITIIRGWPGVGKSSVARAIAHSPILTSAFADGVLWTSLGPFPTIARELTAWGRAMNDESVISADDEAAMSHRLAAMLRDRRMLLIIDDVWEISHARPFLVGGRRCAMLVTTRLPSVADALSSTPDDVYRLDVLSDEDGVRLLGNLAPKIVEAHPTDCRELVRELEGLPLALQVAGRMLRAEGDRGWSVCELLHQLRSDAARLLSAPAPADMAPFVKDVSPTVAVLLQKSTDCLDSETRKRFSRLAPFAPRPAIFAIEDMMAVWRVSEEEARKTVNVLLDRGLLEPLGEGEFAIHQVLVEHAKTLLKRKR